MVKYSSAVCLLVCCVTAAFAFFEEGEVPRQTPEYCSDPVDVGTGRAYIDRFFYNATSRRCEEFVWKGGRSGENSFVSRRRCEGACMGSGGLAPRNLPTCTFSANLERDCSINPEEDLRHLRFCVGQEDGHLDEEECESRGCCFDNGLCFQKTNALAEGDCSIQYSSENGFWGKINFQSYEEFSSGWVGSISISKRVGGEFCLLSDSLDDLELSRSFGNRTGFILPGRGPLYSGQQVNVVFAGTFHQSRRVSSHCRYSNRVEFNREVIDRN